MLSMNMQGLFKHINVTCFYTNCGAEWCVIQHYCKVTEIKLLIYSFIILPLHAIFGIKKNKKIIVFLHNK